MLYRLASATLAVLLLAVALVPVPAQAEPEGRRVTLSPYLGTTIWSDEAGADDNILWGGRLGWMANGYLGVEATYGRSDTSSLIASEGDIKAEHLGVDLMVDLLPYRRVVPYLVAGWGQLYFDRDNGAYRKANGWEGGAGLKVRLTSGEKHRMDLRLEARDVWAKMDMPGDSSNDAAHNWLLTAGINLAFGKSELHDTDHDGVRDGSDDCPGTPYGALVNSRGCPQDSDHDGVFDGIDECPDSPAGATVSRRGCPNDSDADGVLDGLDACPDTPAGTEVDERGCAIPEPEPVVEPTAQEKELLDTGMIRLDNVLFESNKADLQGSSMEPLDELGKMLEHWPELEIEIAGYTDSRGAADWNRELSQARAQAVLDYLTSHFDGIDATQYTVKGYGPDAPIADNATEEGRALNRRVELRVLNRGTLEQ